MILLLILLVTGAFLYVFPGPTVFFVAAVLIHAGAGCLAVAWFGRGMARRWQASTPSGRAGWLLLSSGAAVGMVLIYTGTTRPYQSLLLIHIVLTVSGLTLLASRAVMHVHASRMRVLGRGAAAAALVVLLAAGATAIRQNWRGFVISNPELPPRSMLEEGGGAGGPFFPSSSRTSTGGRVPVDFFTESAQCGRCHEDAYAQWSSSAHHFSSFNNQWYRKSIEYMQDVVGVEPSKWCGGCHDPALLFTGMMDRPIREVIDEPEAHAGLGCVMCHSIAVHDSMGQGGYTIEYPPLYELATSDNALVQALHDFVVHLNPEAHRRAFLKPAMRDQAG